MTSRFFLKLTSYSLLLLVAFAANTARADTSGDMTEMVNDARADHGLDPLARHDDLVTAARRQAAAIADAGHLFHSSDLGSVTDERWTLIGENVAVAGDIASAHRALMNSPGHRDNILNTTYTHMGIGTVVEGGRVWVAQVFMASPTARTDFEPPFSDDDDSVHQDSIARLAASGITSGCGRDRFCPDEAVTRGEMAAFLTRALDLPTASGDPFRDDDSSIFEADIGALASAGITMGCGQNRFCPEAPVTRGEMAAFLARALHLKASDGDRFRDDDRSPFESAIQSLAAAGVTQGCGPETYCPRRSVTRAEMATFLVRAFDL